MKTKQKHKNKDEEGEPKRAPESLLDTYVFDPIETDVRDIAPFFLRKPIPPFRQRFQKRSVGLSGYHLLSVSCKLDERFFCIWSSCSCSLTKTISATFNQRRLHRPKQPTHTCLVSSEKSLCIIVAGLMLWRCFKPFQSEQQKSK